MPKKSFIIFCAGILFVITGREPLRAQLHGQAKGADLFSVYSHQEIANRNMTDRDMRLMGMKGTDTKFSMPDYTSLAQWKKHKKYVRRQLLISAGLWPRPPKMPLHAHVVNKIKHKKYTVETVYIEPYPNFYLVGNLYKPRGIKAPFPGMLMPHGHWDRGRLQNGTPPSGHANSVPGRCIHFAKAGYVAFAYDMVGYNDTKQIGHNFADGDRSAQLWNINLLGLQLWNSMRALEFLRSLPAVDSSQIGITGASGGGTQTFLLDAAVKKGAVDVAAPVNQISSIMQGGEVCENAPGLRLNTFNVEIAAMFAPHPQLMISDTHDWTKNTPWAEYPMMRSIYKLYNATGHVAYDYFDYPHNYNKSSREEVYKWFRRWMPGKRAKALTQPESFTVDPDSSLLAFLKHAVLDRNLTFKEMDPSSYHNLPAGALQMDGAALKRYLKKTAKKQLDKYWPTDQAKWSRFDSLYGIGYRHILADSIPKSVHTKIVKKGSGESFKWEKLLIERAHRHDWIPAILFQPPQQKTKSKGVTLVITPAGKKGVANSNETGPNELVKKLLSRGQSVMAIDVFKTGEHELPEGVKAGRDKSEKHFTTFNKADTQQRIQDILTAGKFLTQKFSDTDINLLGLHRAGIWCILASPLAPMFNRVICSEHQVDPTKPSQLMPFFIPGLAKYGGLQTALALAGKHNTNMTLYNVNPSMDRRKIKAIYKMFGHSEDLSITSRKISQQNIINTLISP